MAIGDRTSEDRKQLILEKAAEIFWSKGYERTSMKDIARACGFEPGNIYNYFRSKEYILYEILLIGAEEIISAIEHLESDDSASPIDQLRYIIHTHVNWVVGKQRITGLLYDMEFRSLSYSHRRSIVKFHDAYTRIISRVIRRGIDRGDFVEMDEKLVGFMIGSMILRMRLWFSQKGKYSSSEIADFVLEFALNGLIATKKAERRRL